MGFADHDEVVERFAPYRSDEPFDVAVLPRRARCGRVTVSGLTTVIAFRMAGKHRYSQTKIKRSMFRSRIRNANIAPSSSTAGARRHSERGFR